MELEREPLHLSDHRGASFPLGPEVLSLLALKHTLLVDGQRRAVPVSRQAAIGAQLELFRRRKRVALLLGDLGPARLVTTTNDAGPQRFVRHALTLLSAVRRSAERACRPYSDPASTAKKSSPRGSLGNTLSRNVCFLCAVFMKGSSTARVVSAVL